MSKISEYLKQIKDAVYGEEVRTSIINAITQCYEDATSGTSSGTSSTVELPDTVAYISPKNENVAELQETATEQKLKMYCYPKSQVYTKAEVYKKDEVYDKAETSEMVKKTNISVNELKDDCDELSESLQKTNNTISELNSKINSMQQTITSLNSTITSQASDISSLRERMSTAENELTNIRNQNK